MAQAVSVILSIIIIRKRPSPFVMKKEYIRFNPEIKRFIRVRTPIAFQEIMTQLSFLALCAFINRLGLDASSGYGVANKIVSFVMLMPGSLMQSMLYSASAHVLFHEYSAGCKSDHDWSGCAMCDDIRDCDQSYIFC